VALKRRFDANRFAFDQVGKNLELCQESEEIIKQYEATRIHEAMYRFNLQQSSIP